MKFLDLIADALELRLRLIDRVNEGFVVLASGCH